MAKSVSFVVALCGLCFPFLLHTHLAAQSVTDTDRLLAQIQTLKAENWQLKVSTAQCQAKLADALLTKEASEVQASQAAFRADIRKKLGAKTDEEVDWATLTLKKKTP